MENEDYITLTEASDFVGKRPIKIWRDIKKMEVAQDENERAFFKEESEKSLRGFRYKFSKKFLIKFYNLPIALLTTEKEIEKDEKENVMENNGSEKENVMESNGNEMEGKKNVMEGEKEKGKGEKESEMERRESEMEKRKSEMESVMEKERNVMEREKNEMESEKEIEKEKREALYQNIALKRDLKHISKSYQEAKKELREKDAEVKSAYLEVGRLQGQVKFLTEGKNRGQEDQEDEKIRHKRKRFWPF